MKRDAFDGDDPLPPRGKPPEMGPRCGCCGLSASQETLSSFGARCGPCYAAYCRQLPALPEKVAATSVPRGTDPRRAWAWKLKARHERGDALTPSQIAAYTDALHQHAEPIEDAYA